MLHQQQDGNELLIELNVGGCNDSFVALWLFRLSDFITIVIVLFFPLAIKAFQRKVSFSVGTNMRLNIIGIDIFESSFS